VVVINAGTNDFAGNTGPSTMEMIEDSLKSMAQVAMAKGIKVVLASVTPAYDYPWRRGLEPAEKIVALNAWMKAWCAQHGCIYCDYFTALADEKHAMKEGLSSDGVHPQQGGVRNHATARAGSGKVGAGPRVYSIRQDESPRCGMAPTTKVRLAVVPLSSGCCDVQDGRCS
jgi:lysophospholipase L1-like esterase